jgi:hypothetical protein
MAKIATVMPELLEGLAQVSEQRAVAAVRDDRHVAGLLDRLLEAALVLGGEAGDAPRNDLAALGDEACEQLWIAPIDLERLVGEERIDLALAAAGTALAGPAFARAIIAAISVAISTVIAIAISISIAPAATATAHAAASSCFAHLKPSS